MKKTTLAIICIAITFIASAQTKTEQFKIAFAPTFSLMTGTAVDSHGYGVGANLQGSVYLSDKFNGFVSVGYSNWFGRTTFNTKVADASIVPVQAGALYSASNFLIGGAAGLGFINYGTSNNSGFLYSPMFGYREGKNGGLDLLVSYNNIMLSSNNNVSWVGLTTVVKL